MPCYKINTAPSGYGKIGTTGYATEAECLEACKEGACCNGTTCSVKPQCQCQGTGQTFKGVGTTCTPNPCNPCLCGDGSQYDFPVSATLSFRNVAVASVVSGPPPSPELLGLINATQMPLTGLAVQGATDVAYGAQPMCDCTGPFGSCLSPCPHVVCWRQSQPTVTVTCTNETSLTDLEIRVFGQCGSSGSIMFILQDQTSSGAFRGPASTTDGRTWCSGRPVVTQAVFPMNPSFASVRDAIVGPSYSFLVSGDVVIDFVHNPLP